MMIETKKRLTLHKETLRTLNAGELGRVAGGGTSGLPGCTVPGGTVFVDTAGNPSLQAMGCPSVPIIIAPSSLVIQPVMPAPGAIIFNP